MRQIIFEHLLEVQHARLAVHKRQHNDTEGALQRSVLIQTVQHYVRHSVSLQLDNDFQAVLQAGEVVNLGNAFDNAVLRQTCNILNQVCFVDLIGDFADNDMMLALVGRHDFRLRTDFYYAAASGIGAGDTGLAQNAGTGREVRALDSRHQLRNVSFRVINKHNKAIDYLAQVMRGNICRHTNSDTGAAVD